MGKTIYICCTLLYLLLYVLKMSGQYFPLISDYLADLLCLPLTLGFCRYVMIKWKFVSSNFELSVAKILLTVAAFSIIFEVVLPKYSHQYQSDFIDIVFYLTGAVIYYFFRKIHDLTRYEIST